MTLTFHALSMLCALGTAVLATSARSLFGWLAIAVGFAIAVAWTHHTGAAIDASWVGTGVALIASWQLVRPDSAIAATVAAAGAGVVAAAWGAVLQLDAIPRLLSLVIAGGTLLSTAWLTNHRPVFAPAALREEALLIVLVLAVVVATAPTVAQGWNSAIALNMTTDSGAPAQSVPAWTLSFVGASIALGGLWAMWRRG